MVQVEIHRLWHLAPVYGKLFAWRTSLRSQPAAPKSTPMLHDNLPSGILMILKKCVKSQTVLPIISIQLELSSASARISAELLLGLCGGDGEKLSTSCPAFGG